MTTLDGVAKKTQAEPSAEQKAAAELVRLAQEQGLSLTGPDGLLRQLTKTVLQTALDEEMTEHLGYESRSGWSGPGQYRNGIGQDGAHRGRSGRARGAPRPGGDVRAAERQEAPAPAVRDR